MEFLEHSYTYHLTRIDHRHNFSVYNTVLHLGSLQASLSGGNVGPRVESIAFMPQLFLAILSLPLLLAKKDLASTILAQTFAFVTFNKVCTSQVREKRSIYASIYAFTSSYMHANHYLVFSMVHGLPPVLPAGFVTAKTSSSRHGGLGLMDSRPGCMAAARIRVGILRPINFRTGAVARQRVVLPRELLDSWDNCAGRRVEGCISMKASLKT